MNTNIHMLAKITSLTIVLALFAAGCSKNNSNKSVSGTPSGTAAASSKGAITGFGSVFVNGVEYDTTAVSVIKDGVSASESDLQIGMVVTVSGSVANSGVTGSAITITYADNLEGPVSALYDPATKSLSVMSQTVRVDGTTTYQNIVDASQLAVNDMVEVSGFSDANGSILASRIEKRSNTLATASTIVELKGYVSNLTGNTFSINALTVNASSVTLPAGLANGSYVEVKGTLAAASGPMTATSVDMKSEFTAGEGEHVELEGIVTDYVSLSSFKINGTPVDGSALTSLTIANNMKIEVHGTMVGGILVADKGDIEQESNVLLEGNVVSLGANNLTLLGKVVTVTAKTEYQDESAANLRSFSFSDIAVDDHVIVVGYESSGGVVATDIERSDVSSQARIQGIVSAATPTTSLTILGIVLETGTASFQDINETSMTAADFFTAVTIGTTVVKVKWNSFTATSAPVDQAALESIL